jgi:hypothetical protein
MRTATRKLVLVLALLAALLGARSASAGPWVPRPVCRFIDLYEQASATDAGLLERLLYLVVLTSGSASHSSS